MEYQSDCSGQCSPSKPAEPLAEKNDELESSEKPMPNELESKPQEVEAPNAGEYLLVVLAIRAHDEPSVEAAGRAIVQAVAEMRSSGYPNAKASYAIYHKPSDSEILGEQEI